MTTNSGEDEIEANYELIRLTGDDVHLIPEMILMYLDGEPLCELIGLTVEDMNEILFENMKRKLPQNLTVAVKEKSTGKLVGFLNGKKFYRGDHMKFNLDLYKSEKAKMYMKGLNATEEAAIVCDMFDVPCAFDHSWLAVHKNYRGKGLGKAMAKKLEQIVTDQGIKLQIVTAINPATNAIYSKIGYKIIFDLPFSELKSDGELLFESNCTTRSKSIAKLFKRT